VKVLAAKTNKISRSQMKQIIIKSHDTNQSSNPKLTKWGSMDVVTDLGGQSSPGKNNNN